MADYEERRSQQSDKMTSDECRTQPCTQRRAPATDDHAVQLSFIMKWEHRVLPFLLVTTSLALPPNGGNGPHQAAFRIDDGLENSFLALEQPPNPNATHHLIFSSVSGLLQRWPNTYRRNGAPDGNPFLLPPKLTCLMHAPLRPSCSKATA
jgi:hypothetical protein